VRSARSVFDASLRVRVRLRRLLAKKGEGAVVAPTLLSIQQTVRYRGLNFLEFLRSGRMEID